MAYERGWVPVTPDEPPAPMGVWIMPEMGALLTVTRYGRKYEKAIRPHESASAQDAAGMVHRRDPDTGELRPITRLTIYDWVRDGVRGKKLRAVRRTIRPNVRPVMHIMLTDLYPFARAAGYEVLRGNSAARRRYTELLTRG